MHLLRSIRKNHSNLVIWLRGVAFCLGLSRLLYRTMNLDVTRLHILRMVREISEFTANCFISRGAYAWDAWVKLGQALDDPLYPIPVLEASLLFEGLPADVSIGKL